MNITFEFNENFPSYCTNSSFLINNEIYKSPIFKPEFFLNENGFFAVFCFVKNFIGATGISAVAIDNKIEQAMDLVKSHLMFAVREEVEVLKEKIAELMDRINHLERENTILRAHAPQEILSQLTPAVSAAKGQHQTNPTNGPFS